MMKSLNPIAALAAILFTQTTCALAAGGDISGGGQGIVCRNDDGIVVSAKLLDLAEAESYYLLPLPTAREGQTYLEIAHQYADILDAAMPSVSPVATTRRHLEGSAPEISYGLNTHVLWDHVNQHFPVWQEVARIDAAKKLIPGDDFQISPVGDSHPRLLPSRRGCGLEQIAVYRDGLRTVHFVEGIWNRLDNLNKAALLIHEALYQRLRTMGDTNSDLTRKVVAHLLGGMKFEWVLAGLPPKFLSCWTTDANASFVFLVYPKSANKVVAQFLTYNGEVMLTKTATVLDSLRFAEPLGMPIPESGLPRGEYGVLANPLLDLPRYAFTSGRRTKPNEISPPTGDVYATFEAVVNVGGTNALPVACQEEASQYSIGADGTVTLDRHTIGGSGRR